MGRNNQQYLFNHFNPLEERLGEDFFDALPREPGIYKMYGRKGELLYVGKAKNLRNRIFTYRRAKVGRVSRKTVRLIRKVHNIELERCKDEKAALLKENELIRLERPEFNRAKKAPETYYFIHLGEEDNEWTFRLNMREQTDGKKEWLSFGAFKGHSLVRRSLGGLLRLLYIMEYRIDSTHLLPPVLLKNLTPMNYRLPLSAKDPATEYDMIQSLLSGSSDQFFERCSEYLGNDDLHEKHIGKLILEDMEVVKQFYEKSCRKNFEIAERFNLASHIIPQKKLDDYLIELHFST